ncbi:F-box protein At5g46170-like [Selaginella moellendorffii]|uniref:F-box protein At5g46170-like n=1 Tax=Selaginella moellendorffii TaxID=88036 RepID=UPI000D1C5417|nr:F-box protein At5g46170-like [Selaginella moellendorffii]|eukprot:XP_024521388.1 F-box protein At5g46170-like [Selaginella moellendorffii]
MYLEEGLIHPEQCLDEQRRQQEGQEEEEEEFDHFERLPDSLLLTIFNKIAEIKALGKCCAVSKRFNSVASQVDNVVVRVDCVLSGEDTNCSSKASKGLVSSLVKLVYGSLLRPFQVLQQMLSFSAGGKKSSGSRPVSATEVSHHSPGEVLRNFKEIQTLRIELPGGELGLEEDIVLKWKAEFGSTVQSCVMLGAYREKVADVKPLESKEAAEEVKVGDCDQHEGEREQQQQQQDDNGSIPETFYTDGSLKSRVVWTISSLIAASARHFLLQQIIAEHPTLERLLLTDADGQGTLCMSKEQLCEFRDSPIAAASVSSNRTQVPALNMKLWYAPLLPLPDGTLLRGATLVAIRPSDTPAPKDLQSLVAGAFQEPYASAASLLVKRRTYLLEMNAF